jgi:hypothetical protein
VAKAKATKAAATKATTDGDGKSDLDPKVAKAATEIRKQGGTAAIISHTLGLTYSAAQRLAAEYDEAHGGHAPSKLVRNAEGIKLAGYTVKDGRQVKPKAKAPKAKAAAKATA